MPTDKDDAEYLSLAAAYRARVREHDSTVPGYEAAWNTLSGKILEFGGLLVVPPLRAEGNIEALTERLEHWDGAGATLVEGEPSHCHSNSARLWVADDVATIATGYGLSDDGLWRQHTWAFDATGRIVETTEVRDVYAGVVLDDVNAVVFSAANLDQDEFLAAMRTEGRVQRIALEVLAEQRDQRAAERDSAEGQDSE